jgi:hypothetical protein
MTPKEANGNNQLAGINLSKKEWENRKISRNIREPTIHFVGNITHDRNAE